MSSIVFGPVISRRFGRSLGIDLSPDHKSCNFDCLYCELPKEQKTTTITNPPSVEKIIFELEAALLKDSACDIITITANGEPTLYPQLDELVVALQKIKGDKKLLILSNGSTIGSPSIQKTLSRLECVKLSLDCATQTCFNKIDRPLDTNVLELIKEMGEFRKIFHGELFIEILLVKGVNDTKENQIALVEAMKIISPDRIDIGTIDRPPAYDVLPLTQNELLDFSAAFEGFNVFVPTRDDKGSVLTHLTSEQLLDMITRRPLGVTEASHLYDQATQHNLDTLVTQSHLIKRCVGSVEFYCSFLEKKGKHE